MHFDAKVRHRSLDRLHAVDDRRGAAGRLHFTAAKTKKAHLDYLLIHLLRPVFQSRLQSRLGDLEQSTASNCWSEISEIRMKFDRESQLEEAHNRHTSSSSNSKSKSLEQLEHLLEPEVCSEIDHSLSHLSHLKTNQNRRPIITDCIGRKE